MVPRSISFVDLKCIPGAIGIMERNNPDEIMTLLKQLGFDEKMGYEINFCQHRALTTNEVINGPRIEGYESLSKEWLESGNASVEARMEAVDDITLRDELLELYRTGSADKTFQNEEVAKAVIKNQKKV